MKIRKIVFVFSTILLVVASYIYARLLAPLSAFAIPFFLISTVILISFSLLIWLPFFFWSFESSEIRPFDRVLERAAHLAMGGLSLLLFVLLARDLAILVSLPFRHFPELVGPIPSLVLFVLAVFLSTLGYAIAKKGPVLKKIVLPSTVNDAPLRIVLVSDLHVGAWIGRRYTESLARQIASLGAIDFLFFTGDIGDGDPARHLADLEPLSNLPVRIGRFAVSGNHEGYWDEAAWNERIRALGFRILENEGVIVETSSGPISVHGVSDPNPDTTRALENLRPEVFSIFLAHQPHHAEAAIKAGVRLQLSGHTHAGQFLPWSLFIGFVHRYAAGLYTVDKTSIYVSTGTGFWGPPFRLGTRSETTLIEFGV